MKSGGVRIYYDEEVLGLGYVKLFWEYSFYVLGYQVVEDGVQQQYVQYLFKGEVIIYIDGIQEVSLLDVCVWKIYQEMG